MAKICIIVPVYNAEKYLSDCIASILDQSFRDFNLVLINDGSKDRSLEICEEYAKKDDRIILLSQGNKGAAAARNRGLDWALTEDIAEYIAFVDSDDWVHPDYLFSLYDGIKTTDCKISMCNAVRSDTRELQLPASDYQFELISPEKMWCRDRNLCVVPWGKLFLAELFKTVRFPEGVKIAEDEFVSYKVLFACKQICIIGSQYYVYFQSENSIMRSEWSPNRMAGIEALEQQQAFFYDRGYKDALHESANTYLYLLDDYTKSIESMDDKNLYHYYYKILKKKLQRGVHIYFSEYRFPIIGNEWVYALVHPIRGKVLLQIRKLKKE